MSEIIAELTMSKRPRERGLILTRGVPGSGKSSWVHDLVGEIANKDKFVLINRDEVRMSICKEWISANKYYIHSSGQPVSVEEMYQFSFKNDILNRKIKDKYWKVVAELLRDEDNELVIIDSCLLETEDIIMIRQITSLLPKKMYITIYEFTEEYGSEHKVPDKIMQQYRYKLDSNRHLAIKLADKYVWVK